MICKVKEIKNFSRLLKISIVEKAADVMPQFIYLSISNEAKYLFFCKDCEESICKNLLKNENEDVLERSALVPLRQGTKVNLYDYFGEEDESFAEVTMIDNSDINIGLLVFYKNTRNGDIYAFLNRCDVNMLEK